MSEKLDNLRKSAQTISAQQQVHTSTAGKPFVPEVLNEQPQGRIPTPKERIIIGSNGQPIVRKEVNLATDLPQEEDPNEGKAKSPQEEVLRPGGMFDQYLRRKTEEAQSYLATKVFKDDEIEQTPDGDNISEENAFEIDEDEAELESVYEGTDEATVYIKREDTFVQQEDGSMEDATRNEIEETGEENLVDLNSMTEEQKQDAVDDMRNETGVDEAADESPKKKIIPAGDILEDNYRYPDDNMELPNDDEMDKRLKESASDTTEELASPTRYHLDLTDYADAEDDMEDLLENEEEEDQEALLTDLRAQITEKIRPTAAKRDISGFSIVRSAKVTTEIPKASGRSAAKWVLPNSGIIVEMSEFGGSEIDYLRDNNNWRVVTQVRNSLKMIYDHVVSPKPQKFENWMKTIAFSDQDDLFMCAYIAGFAGSNYIPYTCPNEKCKYMYLSENLPIMDIVKFNKDGKKKFNALYNSNRTNSKGLYVTEVIPVSAQYAIGMRVPSLYDVYIEGGSYSQGFREKYKRNIGIIPYIDAVYRINWENSGLVEQNYQVFENNPAKTAKSKAIFYSKILDTLSTDEYSSVYAMINAIDERANWYSFQIPEASCPKCKGKIEAEAATARDIFFTRHRLGLLANTSIK